MITYDGSALALSFLPAVPPGKASRSEVARSGEEEVNEDLEYTYHHLRRDMWTLFTSHTPPIPIASRYMVPSAHMTIARFVSVEDTSTGEDGVSDPRKMLDVVEKIEEINAWLEAEFGGEVEGGNGNGGKAKETWTVGEETGLCLRVGRVWYGGGESLGVGRAV